VLNGLNNRVRRKARTTRDWDAHDEKTLVERAPRTYATNEATTPSPIADTVSASL
jgi:hypothetical protein